jgi:formylglycine-generating enzyme required for sulfatase activity
LDMVGNVWEVTSDWYDEAYYQKSPTRNPQGPATGDLAVWRGLGWTTDISVLESELGIITYVCRTRTSDSLHTTYAFAGFRCVVPGSAPATVWR